MPKVNRDELQRLLSGLQGMRKEFGDGSVDNQFASLLLLMEKLVVAIKGGESPDSIRAIFDHIMFIRAVVLGCIDAELGGRDGEQVL